MDSVSEHSPCPILTLTREGRIVAVNAAARALEFEAGTSLPETHAAFELLIQASRELRPGEQLSTSLRVELGELNVDKADVVAVKNADHDLIVYLRMQSAEEIAGSLIRRVVAHTSGTGQTYFEQLVVHLATKLKTRWALVGAVEPGQDSIRTLAACEHGTLIADFEYPLRHSPCDGVLQSGPCFYPAGVQALFPDDPFLLENGVDSYVGVPLFDGDQQAIGLLLLMHDAPLDGATNPTGFLSLFAGRTGTEISRKKAEEEARRQSDFAQQLLDRVGALVLLLNNDGKVLRSNRMVEEVTGWSEARLRGERIWDTVASERAQAVLGMAGHPSVEPVDETWRTPDGETRHVRWEAARIEGPSAATFVLVTGVDLTALEATRRERDRLHARLEESQRLEALGRLAGGVAHDFNNLLLAILGYADLIEMEVEDESELQQFALEIRRASEQAAGLTRQLLAFGRRERLDRRQLNLADVVDGAARILQPLLSAPYTLTASAPSQPVYVIADPGRLENVIVNLAINARDAMSTGGAIAIEAGVLEPDQVHADAPFSRGVYIEVADQGTGIPDDVLPHIFDPFFTTKELGRGTGLGLASVYGTVQQHGGTVDVRTGADTGTTIRICLPMAEPEESGT